jgi:hypothetical protein
VPAHSPQDTYVLNEVYDTLLRVNPYNSGQIFGWMVNAFAFVTHASDPGCPAFAFQCLKMTLRGDIFFHDRLQLTPSDVKFSFLALPATGSSLGSCLGLNSVSDVTFNPAVLPVSLGGTESPGQPEILYVDFNAPPPAAALQCIAGVPILPQHIWASDTTGPCTVTGSVRCSVNPALLGADPVLANLLVGSGPYVCSSGPLGAPGTVIGGGCTSTGIQNVPPGGTITLRRYGAGLPFSTAYFRTNGKYKNWQWSDYYHHGIVDITDFSNLAACYGLNTPLCLSHWDKPAATLVCFPAAGPCIGQVGGGNNNMIVDITEASQVARWYPTTWTYPISYTALTGAEPIPQILYEDGTQEV